MTDVNRIQVVDEANVNGLSSVPQVVELKEESQSTEEIASDVRQTVHT